MGKDTKNRILDAALQLFNSTSVDQVSVREVARKAGISHGNLCYHFPNIEALVENLYFRLVAEQDALFEKMTSVEVSMETLRTSSYESLKILYRYKFLMLDFVSIMRRNKSLREHYRGLYKRRTDQFRNVLRWMMARGYLKKEPFPGVYDRVIEQLFIIGDFWMASAEILYEGKETDKLSYYTGLIDMVLLPYMIDNKTRRKK